MGNEICDLVGAIPENSFKHMMPEVRGVSMIIEEGLTGLSLFRAVFLNGLTEGSKRRKNGGVIGVIGS